MLYVVAAQELIFTTRLVSATEALSMRLVNHCVEEGKAMGRALELARDIAQVNIGSFGTALCCSESE